MVFSFTNDEGMQIKIHQQIVQELSGLRLWRAGEVVEV